MKGDIHHDRGLASGPLSTTRRSARLAARRRQVRRRRAVALGIVALVVAGLVIVVPGGGQPGPHRAASPLSPVQAASKPASPAKPAVHKPHPGPPAASSQASPVDRVLHYTSYVELAGHKHRDVALTFDDGPGPYTSQVLGILRSMHVPATFFVIGSSVNTYPRLVAAEVAAGEQVGDHTESHAALGQLSSSAQAGQLTQAAESIRRAGAPAPVLMRPPYGSFNSTTLQVLRAQRMLMVLWSVDTKDYSRPGADRIVYTAISGARPGAIVLMHDGGGDRSETVAALPRIITRLRQRGFHLVTIPQLVAEDPPPRSQPPPHSLAGF